MSHDPLHVDTILHVRCAYTFVGTPRCAEAVALAGGRIAAIGSRSDVDALKGSVTRVIDLSDAIVTPGLVDTHTHFFYWALSRALEIDLAPFGTLAAIQDAIRQQSATRRVGDWVVARGFDQNRWGGQFPTAAELDSACPDHPAIAHSRDGHSAWLNTAALRRCNITRNTPDPPGGRYLRDERSEPTGIVQETAVEALPNPVRDFALRTDAPTLEAIDRALQGAYEAAWRVGIVGFHTMDDGPSLTHLLRQRQTGKLGLKVVHAVPLANLERAIALGLRSGLGDEWLRIGGVKIFSDGALGSQTAYMFEPYPGRGDYVGVPVVAGDELRQTVAHAVEHGWAAWIHAIGDRAVHETVEAIVASAGTRSLHVPHRVEHAQCVRPNDIRAMARHGIVAAVQPCHILGDIETANRNWPNVLGQTYAFRQMLDAGCIVAAGSDVPIESIDPRRSLFGAVQRTDEGGAPAGGWVSAERITAEETLRAFTLSANAAAGGTAGGGTLSRGAPADLTVWGADPLQVAGEELLQIPMRGTIVGGELHVD